MKSVIAKKPTIILTNKWLFNRSSPTVQLANPICVVTSAQTLNPGLSNVSHCQSSMQKDQLAAY